MATSDAIVVGEDWISEHFFSTDGKQSFHAKVLDRRKQWADAEDESTVHTRFTAARGAIERALADLELDSPDSEKAASPEPSHAAYAQIRAVLGFDGQGYAVTTNGQVTRIASHGLTGTPPLAIIEAVPAETIEDALDKGREGLFDPFETHDGTESLSLSRLISQLFVAPGAPRYVLALAGRWALVAERERWAEGRYLAIDFQLVCERNDTKRGGEADTALTCLSAESLAPDAEGKIWWDSAFEDSVKHTVGVSKDLREGVRLSIEIIANEVVARRKERGLDPLPEEDAQPLAKQALRYLYRILFLLYAEASPELGVLPVGTEEYEKGYSLDRLRELTLAEVTSPQAQQGTHLYESLALLFILVDQGHAPSGDPDTGNGGLTFESLSADLFLPVATSLIDAVGLGNKALQQVLQHLLLSKERTRKDRGFISYAELGINQLGAVYEGLMSYTGFFASEDLYEVAKNGDSSKGSWVVPVTRSEGIAQEDFVRHEHPVTGEQKPVLHPQGSFVFRLAGRERQQSASYYTPEVLTRFTVSQALEELLDQDGTMSTAEEILDLTVCEPALGSGAFAIEATRQLADEYLKRRQAELGGSINPDEYQLELQRVKAYIALHNVYGVDLNGTAVELAEISLWLDTMVKGLQAPWFGLHLRRGNSLIGARRATYSRAQVNDKSWLKNPPRDIPLAELAQNMADGIVAGETDGQIHHFLLPAAGWGSATEAKEAKELAPGAQAVLKKWRGTIRSKPNKKQLDALSELSYRVEVLWQTTLRRLEIAEREARRDIDVWGHEGEGSGSAVTREAIEASLADPNGSYRRLRRVMDAWCALWFWPLTDTGGVEPPTLDRWIDACQRILGRAPEARTAKRASAATLASTRDWDELNATEEMELGLAGTETLDRVLAAHPWLQTCAGLVASQGFFHWELDFATVFATGGFDLQVGNPPWVRPRSDVDALLAEGDAWWQLALKPSEAARAEKHKQTIVLEGIQDLVLNGTVEVAVTAEYVGDATNYPHLAGLQPDLYRCFMEQTWRHASSRGTTGLIHPETHFTDEKAGVLRAATYRRLRRHWQFINELKLFEAQNQKRYGVNVYGPQRAAIAFVTASSLYHPDTVERSRSHDGSGEEPGLKDATGNWDLRPHSGRLVHVSLDSLKAWHNVLEEGDEAVPTLQTRMVYAVNQSVERVLQKLAANPRIGSLEPQYSRGWDESIDRKRGFFISNWGAPSSWDDAILQGSFVFVGTPFYKEPNPTMRNQLDWSPIDLETLPADAIPITSFKPAGAPTKYSASYTHWSSGEASIAARDYYRIAWRNQAPNTGNRTLAPAIIPPGAAHVDGLYSAALPDRDGVTLATVAGFLTSVLNDFLVRSAPKSNIRNNVANRLVVRVDHALCGALAQRMARLSCVTDAYASLWDDIHEATGPWDGWALPTSWRPSSASTARDSEWTRDSAFRIDAERRGALVEVDVLCALMTGISAEELCTVYRTQFGVAAQYERENLYDVNGRLVPREVSNLFRKKGEGLTEEERTATNSSGNTYTYEFPFVGFDREHDYRVAYAEFERRLKEDG